MPNISCIIPAYNEEKNIKPLIQAVKESGFFQEIIVVNDGSTDRTAEFIAQEDYGIIFIDLKKNVGKAGAVWEGFKKATGDIILMLDADLVGVGRHTFAELVRPLLSKTADVCVGVIHSGGDRPWIDFVQKNVHVLSGQQAFWRKMILDAEHIKDKRFGLEPYLRDHFRKKGARIETIKLEGITHLLKEKKMGLIKGFLKRIKMYKEIAVSVVVLLFGGGK